MGESSTEATPDNMKLLVAFAIVLFGVVAAEPGYGYYGHGGYYGGYRGGYYGYGGYRGHYYGKRSADAEPGYGYYSHGYGGYRGGYHGHAYGHGYGYYG